MPATLSLVAWTDSYCLKHGTSRGHRYNFAAAIHSLDAWMGHPPELRDLTEDRISRWVEHLERTANPWSAHNRRRAILTLWRSAAAAGHCQPPGRVRPIRQPVPIPRAWTLEELAKLVSVAEALSGKLHGGRPKSLYWSTIIRAGYDTGFRRGDLLSLKASDVAPDGTVQRVQRKTNQPHTMRLRPTTLAGWRILATLADEPLSWPRHPRFLYDVWSELCRLAGVPYGAFQRLRRTGATACEVAVPGSAPRYCGHRSPEMAARHYVDRSQLPVVQPPEL